MAYLLGSSDTSAYTIDAVYAQNEFYIQTGSNLSGGLAASASGNVTKLNLLITSWVTASIKVCLYENNALLNSVIVPSSVGTGLVQVAFPSTAVVAGAQRYRLGFYKVDASNITLKAKTGSGNETKRREQVGSYTSPTAALGNGLFVDNEVFYWSMEDAGGITIDDTDADTRVTEARTVRVTVISTPPTPANTDIYIDADTNDAIVPDSCTLVSGTTYDIVFTVPDEYAGLPYDEVGYPIIVSTADGDATSGDVPYLPVTGNDFVVLTAAPGDFGTSLGTLAIGDIIEWETNGGDITVNSDGTITSTNPNTTFEARAWDATDSTYGAWALQTLGSGDSGGSSMVQYGLAIIGTVIRGLK